MFTGMELTPKGVEAMANFVAQVREVIGMDVPLAADHFGHIGVNSCIRLGKALEQYNMAWLEDMVPWQYTELLKQIHDAVDIPILTGEDIYLKEGFEKLCRDARGRHHPSRPRNLRRADGDQEDRRYGAVATVCRWRCTSRDTDLLHGERALRRGDRKLPRAGTPLCRYPVVGRPCNGDKPLFDKGFANVPTHRALASH